MKNFSNINEAIEYYENISNKKSDCWKNCTYKTSVECKDCELEHKLVLNWLKNYITIKENIPFFKDIINIFIATHNNTIDNFTKKIIEKINNNDFDDNIKSKEIISIILELSEQNKKEYYKG